MMLPCFHLGIDNLYERNLMAEGPFDKMNFIETSESNQEYMVSPKRTRCCFNENQKKAFGLWILKIIETYQIL